MFSMIFLTIQYFIDDDDMHGNMGITTLLPRLMLDLILHDDTKFGAPTILLYF